MRGIEIVFPVHSKLHLTNLLKNVPLDNYQIVIPDGMVYQNNFRIEIPAKMSLEQILDLVDNSTLILSLILQSFPRNAQIVEITTYDVFLQSDCNFLMLIYDHCYIDIYGKVDHWLLQVAENAKSEGAINITVKTNETDGRYFLDVV